MNSEYFPPISEYLYIDHSRLNSYFEQISDPVYYKKIPLIELGIQNLIPQLYYKQTVSSRAYTSSEKINILIDYLVKTNSIMILSDDSQDDKRICTQHFVLEVRDAIKIIIPTKNLVFGKKNLVLWLSFIQTDKYPLYLFEDCKLPDKIENYSSFTLFKLLLRYENEIRKTILNADVDMNKSQIEKALSLDPVNYLKKIGGKIGLKRKIRVFYRIRHSFNDDCYRFGGIFPFPYRSVVGYPIAIMDSDFF